MKPAPFGKTGLTVSPLGFGAAPIGYLKTERDRTAKILNFLLDHGMNVIDTASGYEESEVVIADCVGHRRGEYVLVSKCGNALPDVDEPAWSAGLIRKTVERSLRRLKTDRLDVMLLHTCDLKTLKQGDVVAELAKAREAGKIRFAGYSGDNEAAAYAAGLAEIAVIEMSVNITDQANLETVLPVCRNNELGVLAKRPIANACWKEYSAQPGFYGDYAKVYAERLKKMGIAPKELGIGGREDEAWTELALRFALSHPGVHCGIVGTTNPHNAEKNISYVEKGPLGAEVLEKLREAFEKGRDGEAWRGQT